MYGYILTNKIFSARLMYNVLFHCLIQLYPGGDKPEVRVGKWNVWYHDSLETLSTVWPGFGQNTQSVGELFIKMLRFYCEEMDFGQTVVSTRQSQPMLRLEKRWKGSCIAIEDPFELSRNLGYGLSGDMNGYIRKILHNALQLFGTPRIHGRHNPHNLDKYLFDAKRLTRGAVRPPPFCNRCGRVGHWVRNCPTNNNSKRDVSDAACSAALNQSEP